jgi:hypothetical protein
MYLERLTKSQTQYRVGLGLGGVHNSCASIALPRLSGFYIYLTTRELVDNYPIKSLSASSNLDRSAAVGNTIVVE